MTMKLTTDRVYTVTRETPLMPEFIPVDPLAAISPEGLRRIKRLQERSTFVPIMMRRKRGIPWFYVSASAPDGEHIGKGWVNSTALLGGGVTEI